MPQSVLEQVMPTMRTAGIVRSERGPAGGYRLNKDPAEITLEHRMTAFLESYHARYAHPYRWTYTGQPLVRGTPFAQTRRQQQRGRVGLGTRSPCWERFMYPPRPYKRLKSPVAVNF